MRFFAGEEVLVRIVDVVLTDMASRGLMIGHEAQTVAVALLKKRKQLGRFHALCFSLQLMHTRVHGIAWSRASAIGSPQSRQTP